MDPFSEALGFVDLLSSQQEIHTLETHSYAEEGPVGEQKSKERRRKWSHTEDVALIGAWLNTSKDPVVAVDQKFGTFWSRIATYYASNPKLVGVEKREPSHCKQRWQKINETVCKFVGSYEAATKLKSSGQNEDDVMKMAYEIFFNDYKVKFTLEHAWRELRHDQKWCGSNSAKGNGASKRRKCSDLHSQSSSSVPVNDVEEEARPTGIKAAKAKGKRLVNKPTSAPEGSSLVEFQSMWEIRQMEFALKEKQNIYRMFVNS
ncbi:PREDICTED: glutathione S-transferase T3-like [Camelina sativa]|uniref:Glutathione S-transferase T3-like n=1 Tax=Camelina sativa TaxID=90675 RepID=A0ABM0T0J4_CAMSA|nr:PREDICTED: glutathione S-transferase T3-like [Camelina sativa]XP_010446274.1 PREDICTED: glutathione S-transferase T3-like [Camelina sativa]XP_010474320.1 PREDICTED: glutathione S-transferase T3-like [Camelina sativa]